VPSKDALDRLARWSAQQDGADQTMCVKAGEDIRLTFLLTFGCDHVRNDNEGQALEGRNASAEEMGEHKLDTIATVVAADAIMPFGLRKSTFRLLASREASLDDPFIGVAAAERTE
jgi:hypothetical protein